MADRALDELLNEAIDAMVARGRFGVPGAELTSLVRIARALVDMPARDFRSRLKSELQRRASMTATAPAAPVRQGFRTVTPYISVPDGDRLIGFLTRTFRAEEVSRSRSSAGFHSEVRIGESMVMIGAGESLRGRERLGAFHVYVPDCDAVCARALEAGATSIGEPADRPYGERSGFVKDFAGNHWYIATRVGGTFAPEGLGTVLPFLFPRGARDFIDFVKRAFGAEEMGVFEESGRVMHGAVRIGDAVMEMGEPEDPPPLSSRFFLYVDDCDAVYRRAVEAGATSLAEPTDQPYGHRTAMVVDPFGYEWVPATLLKVDQQHSPTE
jgi:PhnB protein